MTRLQVRPSQSVQISPQLIMQYELLRLPATELGAHLRDLSYSNPLLDVTERPLCARCGNELPEGRSVCHLCASSSASESQGSGAASSSDDEAASWIEQLARPERLTESLWRQCLESGWPAGDLHIACHLIGDLDEQGFLSSDPAEHAAALELPVAAVESVRQRLMRLEPLGIAARGVRECLLLQLAALTERAPWVECAARLVGEQWEGLMEGELRRAARALGLPAATVERAFERLLERCYLYPAAGGQSDDREGILPPPDARLRLSGIGSAAQLQVEILEERRYAIGISSDYRPMLRQRQTFDRATNDQMGLWVDEVRRVALALRQRWQTLRRVCECVFDFQREFFTTGECCPSRLRPLTREEVANAIGVHPSTVGRAVNGKYVELPNRRVVPLRFFFDSSAPIQALIGQMIAGETSLLSDETLRHHLHRAGWSMTRRAVSMHREGMGILPTHLRRRQRRLHARLGPAGVASTA